MVKTAHATSRPWPGGLLLRGADRTSSDRGNAEAAVVDAFRTATCPAARREWSDATTTVLGLSRRLTAGRFVTIVGAGGVGKTTVAIAVGHHLKRSLAGAVLLVDLGMLSDPKLVATAVASMLVCRCRSRRRNAQPDRSSAQQADCF